MMRLEKHDALGHLLVGMAQTPGAPHPPQPAFNSFAVPAANSFAGPFAPIRHGLHATERFDRYDELDSIVVT
jgi:hypothetical protein